MAPFAWVIGNRTIAEIDASNGQYGGRSTANAGRILGIVGTAFMALALVAVLGVIAVAVVSFSTTS